MLKLESLLFSSEETLRYHHDIFRIMIRLKWIEYQLCESPFQVILKQTKYIKMKSLLM